MKRIKSIAIVVLLGLVTVYALKSGEVSGKAEKSAHEYVVPCGNLIGLEIKSDGLLVLGTGAFEGVDHLMHEPAKSIVKTGDYIIKVNGEKINSVKDMMEKVSTADTGNINLTVKRKGKIMNMDVSVIEACDNSKKLGIWVRESTKGIGTLTCIRMDKTYVALGHGIKDSDAHVLINAGSGSIYNARINNIIKGQKGKPGAVEGTIVTDSKDKLGQVKFNKAYGVNGKIKAVAFDNMWNNGAGAIEVGSADDIRIGNAMIRCQVSGEVKSYSVDIIAINRFNKDGKNLIVKITDSRLLEETGGIIQGMSGSPIIQNNKLVGAVTHVFVDDPTRGYGIFVEEMLKN